MEATVADEFVEETRFCCFDKCDGIFQGKADHGRCSLGCMGMPLLLWNTFEGLLRIVQSLLLSFYSGPGQLELSDM